MRMRQFVFTAFQRRENFRATDSPYLWKTITAGFVTTSHGLAPEMELNAFAVGHNPGKRTGRLVKFETYAITHVLDRQIGALRWPGQITLISRNLSLSRNLICQRRTTE